MSLNAELDFNDSDKKMYYIQMDEIAEEGTIEKLEINLSSKNGNINNFIAGIGTVVDGSWYQIDYNENIQSQNYTINFTDRWIYAVKLTAAAYRLDIGGAIPLLFILNN